MKKGRGSYQNTYDHRNNPNGNLPNSVLVAIPVSAFGAGVLTGYLLFASLGCHGL